MSGGALLMRHQASWDGLMIAEGILTQVTTALPHGQMRHRIWSVQRMSAADLGADQNWCIRECLAASDRPARSPIQGGDHGHSATERAAAVRCSITTSMTERPPSEHHDYYIITSFLSQLTRNHQHGSTFGSATVPEVSAVKLIS